MAAQGTVDEDEVLGKGDVRRLRPVGDAELEQLVVDLLVLAEGVGRLLSQQLDQELEVGIEQITG